MKIEEGDIVIAPFRFMETEKRKLRPCMVLNINPLAVTLVFISSHKLEKTYESEVVLSGEDAKAIGLNMDSRIDFGKRDRCLAVDVVKVIGNIRNVPRHKLRECALAADAAGLFRV